MNTDKKNLLYVFALLALLALAMFLTGCVYKNDTPNNDSNVILPVNNTDLEDVVSQYNANKAAQGQSQVQPGVLCTLYTVPQTTAQIVGALLTTIGSFPYHGAFNQLSEPVGNGLNILPPPLANLYQSWFIVKCTGLLFITDNNWHQFDLNSDDGSNLYISGLLINNDGLHGIQTKSGVKFLSRGAVSFELDFFQSNGNLALILNMDGTLLPAANLYH